MKLSELRETLREIRVSPVKTLGQNFLHDRNLARWIVDQAKIEPDDYVVEIGPGLGALTEFILAKGARVLAIEKDGRLVEFLRERFNDQRFEVVHSDALDYDTRVLFAQPNVKLLGNLPYNISSQLLLKYLAYPSAISFWLFMLQREMADRICAQPSNKDYGALTLQIQFHYKVQRLRSIPATVFFPAPEVGSAIVQLLPRPSSELPACKYDVFVRLVRRGFSQRRKQLRNLLRTEIADWDAVATTIQFDPRARAETLSLQQWVALANSVSPAVPATTSDPSSELFPVVDEKDEILRS